MPKVTPEVTREDRHMRTLKVEMPAAQRPKSDPKRTEVTPTRKVIKFTVAGLESILRNPPKSGRIDYVDAATKGLSLRVGHTGTATWSYMRRIDGKLHRITLGTHAELATDDRASFTVAREKVGDAESALAAGRHPKAEQARERAKVKEARELDRHRIVSVAAAAWRASHLSELAETTQADYTRSLAEFEAEFGDRDLATITRGEIIRHLDKIKLRSPTAANRAAVVVRLLFKFARDRYDLNDNPARDVGNPAKQTARARFLDRDEVRIVWRACENIGYPWGHALRLALCTGQRIGEVGNMRRSDIDATGDYWQQSENKSDRRIDIFLAPLARSILDSCPMTSATGPFFSASTDKAGEPRPLRSDIWTATMQRHVAPALVNAADELGLPHITKPWTAHDLRRTVRTGLTGWCRISPDNAERVLNHAIGGLRKVYDHADYRPHVADALRAWDKELTSIIRGGKPVVVSMRKRGAA